MKAFETFQIKAYEKARAELEKMRAKTWREKLEDFWDDHKDGIVLCGIMGAIWIPAGLYMAHGIKMQKLFNAEVRKKYGPNATHGNIFGGSIPKRRADLEAWEKGSRKEDFDRVMKVAKTLRIGSDDVYTIEGFKNPDDEHIAVAVFQQCGQMFHSDWI